MSTETTSQYLGPLFSPGQIVATPAALDLLQRNREAPQMYLRRHLQGDWGDNCSEDAQLNNHALKCGQRVHSAYGLGSSDERLWVITEADRSVTTLLTPDDY